MKKYIIKELPLFINVKYLSIEGKEKDASIQTRDMMGRQDAKIGDFGENWWIRPQKAVRGKEYANVSGYKKACSMSLIRQGRAKRVLFYYIDHELNGNNYTEKI